MIGAAAGAAIAVPMISMAWAWRRMIGAGVQASPRGVYAFGRFLPWERLELEENRQGLVLVDRKARIFRKHPLPRRTFRIDATLVAELRRLGADVGPHVGREVIHPHGAGADERR